ncbi:unnamed protein product [Gadus morhua 'NCC']
MGLSALGCGGADPLCKSGSAKQARDLQARATGAFWAGSWRTRQGALDVIAKAGSPSSSSSAILVLGARSRGGVVRRRRTSPADTQQPGCENVCYDQAFPSPTSASGCLQIIFCVRRHLIYVGHVLHICALRTKRKEKEEEHRQGSAGSPMTRSCRLRNGGAGIKRQVRLLSQLSVCIKKIDKWNGSRHSHPPPDPRAEREDLQESICAAQLITEDEGLGRCRSWWTSRRLLPATAALADRSR